MRCCGRFKKCVSGLLAESLLRFFIRLVHLVDCLVFLHHGLQYLDLVGLVVCIFCVLKRILRRDGVNYGRDLKQLKLTVSVDLDLNWLLLLSFDLLALFYLFVPVFCDL